MGRSSIPSVVPVVLHPGTTTGTGNDAVGTVVIGASSRWAATSRRTAPAEGVPGGSQPRPRRRSGRGSPPWRPRRPASARQPGRDLTDVRQGVGGEPFSGVHVSQSISALDADPQPLRACARNYAAGLLTGANSIRKGQFLNGVNRQGASAIPIAKVGKNRHRFRLLPAGV